MTVNEDTIDELQSRMNTIEDKLDFILESLNLKYDYERVKKIEREMIRKRKEKAYSKPPLRIEKRYESQDERME